MQLCFSTIFASLQTLSDGTYWSSRLSRKRHIISTPWSWSMCGYRPTTLNETNKAFSDVSPIRFKPCKKFLMSSKICGVVETIFLRWKSRNLEMWKCSPQLFHYQILQDVLVRLMSSCVSQVINKIFPDRSSHQRCSVKIGVLRNFAEFTGKHLCQRLFVPETLL